MTEKVVWHVKLFLFLYRLLDKISSIILVQTSEFPANVYCVGKLSDLYWLLSFVSFIVCLLVLPIQANYLKKPESTKKNHLF